MRIGIALPSIGELAGPAAISQVAQRAEAVGYESLWVIDRLLFPVEPRTRYWAEPDGLLPDAYRRSLAPLETLAFAAAHTQRAKLGISVLNIPFYNPVMLARSLTTLDILSNGRLQVGLGQGWSEDEFEAAGVSMKARGKRADEFIQVLKTVWGADPVEFHGDFYSVPRSIIGAKPVQQPHPPIYLAAFEPAALKRVATSTNGWNPAALSASVMRQMSGAMRAEALAAGRDPEELNVVVRANVYITALPLGDDRMIFRGSLSQIRSDIEAVRDLGVSELFFDLNFSPDGQQLDSFLSRMTQLHDIADEVLHSTQLVALAAD